MRPGRTIFAASLILLALASCEGDRREERLRAAGPFRGTDAGGGRGRRGPEVRGLRRMPPGGEWRYRRRGSKPAWRLRAVDGHEQPTVRLHRRVDRSRRAVGRGDARRVDCGSAQGRAWHENALRRGLRSARSGGYYRLSEAVNRLSRVKPASACAADLTSGWRSSAWCHLRPSRRRLRPPRQR